MKASFAWAKGARLVAGGAGVEADLRLALSGAPFRIGGANNEKLGALEAGAGQFETLTSGSSGAPRRIVRTMESWMASFAVNARLFGIGEGCHVAVLGGLEQSLALYGAVESLHLGADLSVLGGMPPSQQMAALAAVDVLWASPAQLRLLLSAAGELPRLRHVIIGGSKLDDALRAELHARMGAQVAEFYGAAEASFITLAQAGAVSASVGVPYLKVDLRVQDGEVWLRSPYTFLRYAGGDQGSARWVDGWLSVGEMGRLAGGHLYLHGRAGRMVTVADHNVFPEEIEARMMALAGVRQAAVLPRRDALRGVHMVAVAQGDAAQEAAILAVLRGEFGPLKAPKSIQWRCDWPCLPSGKTDLRALQAEVDAWPL
ncbi:MAG: AMP-binding protein [Cypionkella sp.]|nr:AMP-binding protein [Cypionkella sp.]